MALAAASGFASFDINAQTQILDISPVLSEAIYLDMNWLSEGVNVDFGNPVEDTVYYWNQEALNARTATANGSFGTSVTTLTVTDGQQTRFRVGDEVTDSSIGATEVMQVTAIPGTGSLTVTRAYGGSAVSSFASGATLVIMNASQEASDFGTGNAVPPTALSNSTHILFANDLQVSRSQRNRRMATIALDVERQLANRAIELKFDLVRASIYSELNATTAAGSDTQYRTMKGYRAWVRDNSGIMSSTAQALTYANLNTVNLSVVNVGKYPNRLAIGTDLVGSVAGYDSGNRRMLESDRQAGYFIQQVVLNQGNSVNVIVDGRINTGNAMLYADDQVTLRPFVGSGMFVIAATDFIDGVKRRLGAEWGLEFRHPEAAAWMLNKT